MKIFTLFMLLLTSLGIGHAQEGDSKAATGGARPGQMNPGFIGRDVPSFDPGSDVSSYDGKIWNVSNNRIFRARFEKYLNAPAETSEADLQYEKTIGEILSLLSPGKANSANLDNAWKLLPKASEYKSDANLCNSLADVVYSVWLAKNEVSRLEMANRTLQKEKSALEWNYFMNLKDDVAKKSPVTVGTNAAPSQEEEKESRVDPIKEQISEVRSTIVNNKLKKEASLVQAKIDFQSLIIQYFAQRRFRHVLIGTRFYRSLFGDGDNRLQAMDQIASSLPVDKDAGQVKLKGKVNPKVAAQAGSRGGVGAGVGTGGTNQGTGAGANANSSGGAFSAEGIQLGFENLGVESLISAGASGLKALGKMINSLGQLDALANEAIRDVDEGIETYKFLLEKNELKSATERLFETFMMGEYMPSVRKLSRDEKRRALEFTRKTNELLAALEVNDLGRAEDLIKELSQTARDFDTSKPMAVVETAKTVSAMHLAKAKGAASSGDRATLEKELREATEIWPRNPALAQVSGAIFSQTDVQQQSLNDFDRLYEQRNLRQIYDDKLRFIAATAMFPERQEKLKKALDQVQLAEGALLRASELSKRGDPAGAWESIEKGFSDYPDDPKLNQARADLTTQASEFVRSLRVAQEMERKQQIGSSLAWYLHAQQDYPNSEMAREGVSRLAELILKK